MYSRAVLKQFQNCKIRISNNNNLPSLNNFFLFFKFFFQYLRRCKWSLLGRRHNSFLWNILWRRRRDKRYKVSPKKLAENDTRCWNAVSPRFRLKFLGGVDLYLKESRRWFFSETHKDRRSCSNVEIGKKNSNTIKLIVPIVVKTFNKNHFFSWIFCWKTHKNS